MTTPPTSGAMFDTDELVINMGPQHPSTHGVLRVVLRLDGERVVDADVVIGYLHRGIEKLCENRDWTQIGPADRPHGLRRGGHQQPRLLRDRREAALARGAAPREVHPHRPLGTAAAGQPPRVARHARDGHRRGDGVPVTASANGSSILDLFEEYCGARLTYNCMRVGGLPQDLPPGWDTKVRLICDIIDEKVVEYETLLTQNRIWLERTREVGVISGADAIAIGLCGPPLRASGVLRDLRKDEPYAAYERVRVRHPARVEGRHLRPVPRAARGVPAVHADHPPGARRPARGAGHRARCRASSSRPPARPTTPSSRRRARSGSSSRATGSRSRRIASACGRLPSATCRRCGNCAAGTSWQTSSR